MAVAAEANAWFHPAQRRYNALQAQQPRWPLRQAPVRMVRTSSAKIDQPTMNKHQAWRGCSFRILNWLGKAYCPASEDLATKLQAPCKISKPAQRKAALHSWRSQNFWSSTPCERPVATKCCFTVTRREKPSATSGASSMLKQAHCPAFGHWLPNAFWASASRAGPSSLKETLPKHYARCV